jgi:hypothetical protein
VVEQEWWWWSRSGGGGAGVVVVGQGKARHFGLRGTVAPTDDPPSPTLHSPRPLAGNRVVRSSVVTAQPATHLGTSCRPSVRPSSRRHHDNVQSCRASPAGADTGCSHRQLVGWTSQPVAREREQNHCRSRTCHRKHQPATGRRTPVPTSPSPTGLLRRSRRAVVFFVVVRGSVVSRWYVDLFPWL